MAPALCRVSFIDSDGIHHSARVHAESVYEAVALAVAEFSARSVDLQARADDRVHSRYRPPARRAPYQAESGLKTGRNHDERGAGWDYETTTRTDTARQRVGRSETVYFRVGIGTMDTTAGVRMIYERALQNRMDGRHLEPAQGLHEDQSRVQILLRRDLCGIASLVQGGDQILALAWR
jgi:hypothetical protein